MHEKYTLAMSLALDGMLTSEEEAELHAHLAACAACRATWALWQEIDRRLAANACQPAATPAAGFGARVEARLLARQFRRRSALGGLLFLIASLATWMLVAAVGAGLIGWWLADHPQLLSKLVSLIAALITSATALAEGIRLFWNSLFAPSMQPMMAGCLALVLILSAAWVGLVMGTGRRLGRAAA